MHHEIKSGARSDKVLWLVQLTDKLFFSHLLFTKWEKSVHFLRGVWVLPTFSISAGWWHLCNIVFWLLSSEWILCLPGVFIDYQIFSHSSSSRLSKPHFLSFPAVHFYSFPYITLEDLWASSSVNHQFCKAMKRMPKAATGGLCQQLCRSAKREMRLSILLCRGILRGLTRPAVCSQKWAHYPCNPTGSETKPALCTPTF